MIHNIIVGGGSGVSAEMNFDIVGGTTKPSNPKENTIWINTEHKITNKIFSITEPEAPTEGTVWMQIGTSSSVPFEAVDGDNLILMAYPTYTQQYISGAWVTKPTETYVDGEWKPWITDVFLFENGVTNTEVFGNITGSEFTITNGSIRLRRYCSVSHEKAFDITPYKTFQIVIKVYEWVNGSVYLRNSAGSNVASISYTSQTGTRSVDISNLSGLHSVYISGNANAAADYTDISAIRFLV